MSSDRAKIRRLPKRANYDREAVYAVLDEGKVAHVGFATDGQPFVIPMAYARRGNTVLLHGSSASRLMKQLATGVPVSIAVTHLDGIVVARSLFHSSMNYRSVVLFGTATSIDDPAEKREALIALSEHLIPGRSSDARGPSDQELKITSVLKVSIEDASLKARTGGAIDDEEDYAMPVWAGVIPLSLQAGDPLPDERLAAGMRLPEYLVRVRA